MVETWLLCNRIGVCLKTSPVLDNQLVIFLGGFSLILCDNVLQEKLNDEDAVQK